MTDHWERPPVSSGLAVRLVLALGRAMAPLMVMTGYPMRAYVGIRARR